MPSVMQSVGTPNARHNLDLEYRKQLENVDRKLSEYNEVIRRCNVDQIYAEHLQASFERFNEKQKRKDRRLDVKWGVSTFLEYQRELDKAARQSSNSIDQKGRPPIREIIWQFGNPEQGYGCNNQTPERRREIIDMLRECQEEAERRFPQFAWGDVVAHADEVSFDAEGKEHGSIHLHSSFVPICHQNKQGPDRQVAFERCLREMGYSTFEAWKHELDSIMEDVLQRHGLERTFMENDNEHQNATEYHRQQKLLAQSKEYEKEAAAARAEAETVKEETTRLRRELEKAEAEAVHLQADLAACEIETQPVMLRQDEVKVKKADLEALTQQAKAYVACRTYLDERQAELDIEAKKLRDERSNIAIDRVHIKDDWADFDRKQKEFREEKGSFEAERVAFNKIVANVKAREEKVKQLEELPEKYNTLAQEHNALQARYLALEESFETKVKKKVEEATEELNGEIERLNDRCGRLAKAVQILLQGVRYVKERFAGEVSREILGGVYSIGNQFLKVLGFEERAKPEAILPDVVRRVMKAPLEFRKGEEGKGVYSPNGTLIMECSSAKEARELFPNAPVKDRSQQEWQL